MNEFNDLVDIWPESPQDASRPEILVADLDHTALSDPALVPRFLVAALFRAGCDVSFDEVHHLIGNPVRAILTEMIVRHRVVPLADACRRALVVEEDFSRRLTELIGQAQEHRPMPGAEHAFAALQSEGIRIALDSALSRSVVDVLLRKLGWLRNGLVDAVAAADEVEAGRPSGEAILLVVKRANVRAGARMAKLAATPSDIAAAHAAGCRHILAYTGGPFSAEALRAQRPTHVIGSLGEVSEALIDRVLA